MLKPTLIKPKIFQESNQLGLSMDMDLAVAKLNLAGCDVTQKKTGSD
jgi:hypothetical protein